MEMRHYWEENGNSHKYDKTKNCYNRTSPPNSREIGFNHSNGYGPAASDQLNFAAASEDEGDYPTSGYLKKGKVSRQDPMSHRIIEKRRRDRMNNCLADLSRLIPPEYLKKGRGRVEKTEIIEMAIRHLKYLQERASERQQGEEPFVAGYQGAVTEVLRFLVEVQGYEPTDGLCAQLYAHMQMNCEAVSKGVNTDIKHARCSSSGRVHIGACLIRFQNCEVKYDKFRFHQQSSDTASSSSNSYTYASQPAPAADPAPALSYKPENYDDQPQDECYSMESDKADTGNSKGIEPVPLDGRRKKDPTLRAVRKPEHNGDQLHSYKFKNSIERRFSKSQDNEAAEMSERSTNKIYPHKRRRTIKHSPSISTTASGYTEETINTSAKDTSSESTSHQHYEKPQLPTQYVPVFALNSLGKYYVPLNVDYECLSKHLGPYDAFDARAVQRVAPLHPVTIHVNFQPSLNYHVKRENIEDREWTCMK